MEIIRKEDYKDCLSYIEKYWKKITYRQTQDKGVTIGLPNAFVSPNNTIYAGDQFYWDSYFTILGLLAAGKVELAQGMVDNLLFCFDRFGIIPMRNRLYELGISQIPFLVPMIEEVFQATHDKRWLQRAAAIAGNELKNYWMNEIRVERRCVFEGLSRYCDHYIISATTEQESGWDMTSRFQENCLDFLPVDLNSCLYQYEAGLARIYTILKDGKKTALYRRAAERRRKKMKALMWDNERGFFFDFNYQKRQQNVFYSVAGFYPLWAKIATPREAEQVRKNLSLLECDGGIANTQPNNLSARFKQHDYPNGWPQQQWIVVQGLLNYGFAKDAERIAKKWLDMNKEIFERTEKFWEKYDVVEREIGKPGQYPTQSGFSWTNAIFVKFVSRFYSLV